MIPVEDGDVFASIPIESADAVKELELGGATLAGASAVVYLTELDEAARAEALRNTGVLFASSSSSLGSRGSPMIRCRTTMSALRDGAEHLANEHCGRRVLGEMVGRAGRNQGHAEVPKMIVTGELHSLAKFIAMRRASSR